jgi:hypothetical protein
MQTFFMYKYLKNNFREYIFIILTATIFYTIFSSISFSKDNVFIIDNVTVEAKVNLNFSRKQYINKVFIKSFNTLKSKILLNRDSQRINNISLKTISSLISKFQIIDETYEKNTYKAKFRIFYSEKKVKKFLKNKNLSFSQPENITAIFFPILFINDKIQSFNENYFYKKWKNIDVNNETVNFILPIDDLDDFSKIKKMKKNLSEIKVNDFIDSYNIDNFAFAIMNYENEKLNIHMKTNFNNNKSTKNIAYEVTNIKDETNLEFILKDIKKILIDTWKEANIVNLLMPLSIKLKFLHKNISSFENLKSVFYKINIIDNFVLEDFNTNNSSFKLYYYGNPKKLKTELKKFGYNLSNSQGYWELNLDD